MAHRLPDTDLAVGEPRHEDAEAANERTMGFVRRLEEAERDRRPIARFTADDLGFDSALGYEVQRIRHERRLRAGDAPLGYKLGLTSRAKQEAMGVAEPLWGRLAAGMALDEDEPLEVSSLIHPRVESEIAFLIGRELNGASATPVSVLAATEAVFPALEVLDSRFRDFSFAHPDVVADNGSASRVVLGGRLVAPRDIDLRLEGMVLRQNGAVAATAAGAAISGDPAAAVAWLARQLGTVEAGSVVLSGGLTAPVALAPGSGVSAEFTTLGSVHLRCR